MSVTKCPQCDSVLFLTAEPGGNWKRDQRFESTSNPFGEAQLAGSWSKFTPHSKLEPRDILTSLLDSGVTFIFAGVAGGGLGYIGGLNPLGVGATVGFLGAAFRYFDGMGIARSLTQAVEEWASPDEAPAPAAAPPATAHIVRAETRDADGNWRFADLPAEPAKMAMFAGAIIGGKSFAERTATACGLTQAQFSSIRDIFIERGWARWNHPDRKQNGVSLTRKGVALMRAMDEEPLPAEGN